MKVDNYAVSLNAQHFNMERNFTEAKLTTESENFQSASSSNIHSSELDTKQRESAYDKLSVELSKAILQNVALESRRSTRDILEMSYTYEERQSLNFETQAYIRSDSKEMTLSLNVSLSRSFIEKSNIRLEDLQMLKDPLVLSFDGQMPSLSTERFSFDIDSDGESEQISMLNQGAAFLALDKNSNGTIDDGSELFGTQSGDGFADLRAYDDDKNGWIDENDAIFDKLRVWQKDGTQERLLALGEVGVGAIFLGNIDTPFSLKSDTNALLGEIRRSGFFVFEDGRASIVSHVDMVASKETQDDVQKVQDLQKSISTLELDRTYKNNKDESGDFGNKELEKLQNKLDALKAKLSTAKEEDKAALQTQIAGIFAQMMSIIAAKLT